jgi:hypothetical protein
VLIYIAIAGEHKKVGGIYMESYTFDRCPIFMTFTIRGSVHIAAKTAT